MHDTTHVLADVQRITLNASCMTISGGRTEQLVIIAGFLPRHWLYEWFSQFHSCGTYSVLSRSPSIYSLKVSNIQWTVHQTITVRVHSCYWTLQLQNMVVSKMHLCQSAKLVFIMRTHVCKNNSYSSRCGRRLLTDSQFHPQTHMYDLH